MRYDGHDIHIIESGQDVEFEDTAPPREKMKRSGDSLWRVLSERNINMIAFSGSIGNGLFLGSGISIASAGPGGAVMSYLIVGTVIASIISCLGEMTALMPVNAPMMEFPRRFLDRGVGFAVGWVYWFAYAVLAASQVVAFANALRFSYDDTDIGGKTNIQWSIGENVDSAVWISICLVVIVVINFLPVIIYGELEYIFGCIKMTLLVILIMTMLVFDVMNPRPGAYYTKPLGTKCPIGSLLGVWTTFINVMFSYIGMDIVAATAAESRALADSESMKMAARKINIRIITLYALAVTTASFVVPYDHPFINGAGTSVSSRSVFIIAAVEAGVPMLAQFFNAMFVVSAFTCAINSLYVASRVLHTLALRGQTGPEFITRRLRACRCGVPIRAVVATAMLMLIAYMGRSGSPGSRLDELSNNCTVSCLIVYATICATYMRFYNTLEVAKMSEDTSAAQAASYDRDSPLYPYKSHGQWLKAFYGLAGSCVLLIFNGVPAFLEKPFNVRKFVSAYVGIPVYILLVVGYKFRKHGFRFSHWGPERSDDLSNTVRAASEKRRGRLDLPDWGVTRANWQALGHWLWVWIK
ncbi:proline-specific permease [Cordyceps fumosorosea ARSEF 2679]|uniref:Proline-specific permease n=1 Tax=Cordyceps fumosorosea (strain ARSEF 2679) TaxID=1081104 RepID=A0A162JAY1_CORFA|nr:proline-specific permease [Cordyceps fumosorosea ARSEF 2679]OAA66292.1 proline-specific permease [Cordyceps fumosorosea ARSEF 2679]